MGKADVCESDYLENEEIFADLVNGVLYQGEQVVKPCELEERDGELRSILENSAKKMLRDKVKIWKGTVIAVLVVENQTKVDYRMVTRAMLAESIAYDKQWKKLRDKNRAGEKLQGEEMKTESAVAGESLMLERLKVQAAAGEQMPSDEFISGMRKGDKFIPVITIVVYYGKEKPWDGARTLYELLDVEGDEEKILPFISNYRLNLFDYHDYDDFDRFQSELQPVFEFLRYAGDKESMKTRMERHREKYESLSSQAKVLLTELTNIKEIPGVGEEEFKKGDFSMCKAFEDMRKEGFDEGREKGRAEEIIETGREFKLSGEEILQRLQNKLGISLGKAKEYFRIYNKQMIK